MESRADKVVIDRDHRPWICLDCRRDVRIVRDEPSRPCVFCGGSRWNEIDGREKEELFDELRPKSVDTARVFFCRRCELEVRTKWDGSGIDSAACKYCGSRYWNELVGDAKIEFLKDELSADGSSVE